MGSWPVKSGTLADWCSMEDACQPLSQDYASPWSQRVVERGIMALLGHQDLLP